MKEKFLIVIASMLGVSGVAFGMIEDNNTIFFFGIFMVIASYLAIRRKLKAALREKASMEE
jgi:lipoprotein signal peptidase